MDRHRVTRRFCNCSDACSYGQHCDLFAIGRYRFVATRDHSPRYATSEAASFPTFSYAIFDSHIEAYFRIAIKTCPSRNNPSAGAINHRLIESVIGFLKNSQLAIENAHSDQGRCSDHPSTEYGSPVSSVFLFFCGIVLAVVSSKMAYKTTEWRGYQSILLLPCCFPIFFHAFRSIIYAFRNLFFPIFWEHDQYYGIWRGGCGRGVVSKERCRDFFQPAADLRKPSKQ